MGGNAVRLVNGGSIQVRTGVLQGIGPQGPTGPVGPAGPEGPQGPVGEVGPQGAITQMQGKETITSPTTIAPDTDTLVAFQTVTYDDMSCFTSTTNITLKDIGDYLISCWVQFNLGANAGDSIRSLWAVSATNGIIGRSSCLAVADDVTYVNVAMQHRSTVANEVVNIKARSSDDVSLTISAGAVTVTRVGSGPPGVAGPIGPVGPVGPTGPAGPTGATGSGGHHPTYTDLMP